MKKRIKEAIKNFKKIISCLTILFISSILSILPKKNNKVLFLSDTREELGGNLKYMYEYISDKYEKIIILKPDRRSKRKMKEKWNLLFHLATAQYIFLEDMVQVTSYFVITKKQELIQLWHGPGAFKKFGYSRLKSNGGDLDKVHRGYRKYTKAIVSGEGIRKNYAEAFGIDINKVYAKGFLRTDDFFNKKIIKAKQNELYKKYPEFKNKKVILFAPTYRGTPYKSTYEGGASYDFHQLDCKKIYENLHKEYVFVFKWHPALYNNMIHENIIIPRMGDYHDFYYDLSEYRDMNDLLLIADILITDYSSVIFDYVLLNKPIIYFTYDLEEYENNRGMYYSFGEYVFGNIAKNTNQLIEAIINNDLMPQKREQFIDKFMNACDGHSTEKTYELVFNNKNSQK